MKKSLKLILLAPVILLAFNAIGQPTFDLVFESRKIDSATFEVTAKGALPLKWYVYAQNDMEGLTSPTLTFDYENVSALGASTIRSSAKTITDPIFENRKVAVYEGNFSLIQRISVGGVVPASLKGKLVLYTGNAQEFYPVELPFEISLEGGVQSGSADARIRLASIDMENPLGDCGQQEKQESTLWGIFLLGFAGGLVALLTPCVFPMIPFTVSYFTRSSPSRKAAIRNGMIYGFFIFLIYILLSVPFHVVGNVNPEIFNTISTNAYLNILFFCVFMFFALSFFGFFELTLPGSLANSADSKSGLSNLGGIFFMSLTLALVSFSCTGPILGSLLVGSLTGGVWPLTAGLAGFGAALGLPFGLFAVFPDLLKSLPKSGGWLDAVKKVLGFVEVALAFKFLSNADLVMHWGILKREVFVGLWLLLSLGLAGYLFGFIRLPHDTKGVKIAAGRKVLGTITLLFAIYLVPGVTPSLFWRLDFLSGFPPPLSYSVFEKRSGDHNVLEANVVNDYERAIQLSDSLNKPLLIDFTGWACVNCRKMEENVWNQSDVSGYIKEHYVLLSLYVDDREKLPIRERITYTTRDQGKKDLVTLGDKWTTFEAENFGQVSQPFYVILSNTEKLLNNPVGYTPDASEYLTWLKCGKDTFDKGFR